MSTLVIENVKNEFLPVFKTLSKAINTKSRVEKIKKLKLTKFEKRDFKGKSRG